MNLQTATVKYRFDMRGAYEAGEHRHPEIVIREWFGDAENLEPVTIADCWMFNAAQRLDAPGYFSEVPKREPFDVKIVEPNPAGRAAFERTIASAGDVSGLSAQDHIDVGWMCAIDAVRNWLREQEPRDPGARELFDALSVELDELYESAARPAKPPST